ncbi:MAG: tetratricopeptide repeat protein [Treponema sp.]|jgi:tetratricopeptide (TPR) repeat protein|nr:tetratricopeptide repeat protein [Treponema sp.]
MAERTVLPGGKPMIQLVKSERDEPVPQGASVSIGERFNRFIQQHRKPIVLGALGILVLLVGFIAAVSIRDGLHTRSLAQLADFNRRYEAIRIDLNEPAKADEVQALLEELSAFAAKQRGYVGARAYSLVASIHGDKKAWEEAEKAWITAAQRGAKTYLGPVSLYNAAVAAEEGGTISRAIDLYRQSAAYKDTFPAAPHAQFSLGRLLEGQNNPEAALEAYQALLNTWPNDTVWTNLARSRIIFLKSR